MAFDEHVAGRDELCGVFALAVGVVVYCALIHVYRLVWMAWGCLLCVWIGT